MSELVSIIIPNRNGEATIERCLKAAFASRYEDFEVIVVDDASTDNSIEIIKKFPCALIELDNHRGASKARNTGVNHCNGTILFFIDADCLLLEDTLEIAIDALAAANDKIILGGTYTVKPADENFFGRFQSVFINHFESQHSERPDYIATHSMVIHKSVFKRGAGFSENYLPILEDVEFSHRLRRNGCKLVFNPKILVRHIFNFSLGTSLKNGFRKAMYWVIYSLENKDLLADSGTASRALKFNVVTVFVSSLVIALMVISGEKSLLIIILSLMGINLVTNRGVLRAFYEAGGMRFFVAAAAYYLLLYPWAVGAGGLVGAISYNRFARKREGLIDV